MIIKQYKKHEVLFYEGEESNHFYLILEGSVNIIIKNKQSQKHKDEEFFLKQQNNQNLFERSTGLFKHKIVAELKSGTAFGELGIIKE